MNLILILEYNQEKDNLVLLKNVLVNYILNIMLLNILNKKKEIQILKKYKLDNKLRIYKILFNNMIFIFDNIIINQIINIMILL